MSIEVMKRTESVPVELQEKVLLGGDLSKLTPQERLSYYNAVCSSVGLNPLTRPFEYLVLAQGDDRKMVLYARKDCTDQLRENHGISVEIVSREVIDMIFVVTARARNITERFDESIGAVPIMKENGRWDRTESGKPFFKPDGTYAALGLEARSNAMMKAETKAKRRVTLSICGLGMLDESEIESIPDARNVRIDVEDKPLPTGAEMLAKMEENKTGQEDGLDGTIEAKRGVSEPISPVNQDVHAPTIFSQTSVYADHELVLREFADEASGERAWDDVTKDGQMTSEQKGKLYQVYQRRLKAIKRK